MSQSFELLLLLALGRVLREREAGRAFGVGRRVGDCGGRKHVSEDGEVRVLGLEGGGVGASRKVASECAVQERVGGRARAGHTPLVLSGQ